MDDKYDFEIRRAAVRYNARQLIRFTELSPVVQEGVLEMARIIAADESDSGDVVMAVSTMQEALWPHETA